MHRIQPLFSFTEGAEIQRAREKRKDNGSELGSRDGVGRWGSGQEKGDDPGKVTLALPTRESVGLRFPFTQLEAPLSFWVAADMAGSGLSSSVPVEVTAIFMQSRFPVSLLPSGHRGPPCNLGNYLSPTALSNHFTGLCMLFPHFFERRLLIVP